MLHFATQMSVCEADAQEDQLVIYLIWWENVFIPQPMQGDRSCF